MTDPWQLAQSFINNLQNQAAQSRATGDNALLRMFGANVNRGDAAIGQRYALQTLDQRNQYATEADTTAFNRQLQRDETGYKRDDMRYGRARADALTDDARNYGQDIDKTILTQKLLAEREAAERGDLGGVRRFGSFSSGDPYIDATVGRESGGKANAKNPLSSARGYGQFTDGTWAAVARSHPELGLTPDGRSDPEQSKRAMMAFTDDNVRVLQQNGIEPTPGNKYAAHFLGAGGAVRALRHPDDTPMAAVVDPQTLQANPFLAGMSVGKFKQWTASKYGPDAGSTADATGPRRYVQPGDDTSYSSQVFNTPVSNTAGDRTDDGSIPPVSPWMKDYLDKNGLEAKERITLTEAQLSLLPPELASQLIPDIADTATDGRKGAKTEYIRVEPRTQVNENASPLPTPKKTVTEAAPIEVKPTPKRTFKDGKLQLDDGREINLPD